MATSAQEIARSLADKLALGKYAPGSRMPSCRDLAAELQINRNTANKVYAALVEMGLVKAVRGRGYMVISNRVKASGLSPTLRDRILAAGREAKLIGMGREAFIEALVEVASSLYQQEGPRVGLVECNEEDALVLSRQLEKELAHPVEPLLLSTTQTDAAATAEKYDIVCTPLYHFTDTLTTLSPVGGQDKVIPFHAPPDADVLMELARVDVRKRVGIVGEFPAALPYIAGSVSMIYQGGIESCLLSENQRVADMARRVDIIVDTVGCHQRLVDLLPPALPVLTIRFRLDTNSLGPLRHRLLELRSREIQRVFPSTKRAE